MTLQGIRKGYRRVTKGYKRLNGVREVKVGYQRLQGVTRGHMG